jgi:N-acetylglucosaminyldiphosphoundecaprenol N-acetyl-beta-D-mannosaminyltransferase
MSLYQIEFQGLKIHPWTMQESLDFIEVNILKRKKNLQHVVVNSAKIVYAQKDQMLKRAINNSDLVNIDGMAVVWGLKLIGYNVKERVSGIDLFHKLLQLASEKGYRVYFLGAKSDILDNMIMNLKNKYIDLNIVGFYHGYFQKDEEEYIARQIRDSRADMLFIGITSPKKELFIDKHLEFINIPFSMGVGGSFDIISGKTKRAPKWMQKNGLEWIYRIIQEPRRLWKRYAYTNTVFIYMVMKEIFRKII